MKNLYSILIAILALVVFAPLSAVADTWGDQLDPAVRFTVLPGYAGTAVLDNETRLVWEQSPDTGTGNWFDAQIHCNQRNVGNRKGWRLPTIQELASLVDPTQSNPALPSGHPFANVLFEYWSATTSARFTGSAWTVFFNSGVVGFDNKFADNFVWCVRGGQGVDSQ